MEIMAFISFFCIDSLYQAKSYQTNCVSFGANKKKIISYSKVIYVIPINKFKQL